MARLKSGRLLQIRVFHLNRLLRDKLLNSRLAELFEGLRVQVEGKQAFIKVLHATICGLGLRWKALLIHVIFATLKIIFE